MVAKYAAKVWLFLFSLQAPMHTKSLMILKKNNTLKALQKGELAHFLVMVYMLIW